MERRDRQLILKIISEIDMAGTLMGDASLEQFKENEMQKRAICMTVINIGELIKNVSDAVRKSNAGIPWKEAAGFRDIAAHKYQTLHMEDVYITVKEDFPFLRDALSKLL